MMFDRPPSSSGALPRLTPIPARWTGTALALVGLVGLALSQDGAVPQPGGNGQGPLAPQPLTVQVEPAPALEHDADAVAVLDAAETAIASLKSFRATITCLGQGVFKDTAERGSVQVIGRRNPAAPDRWSYRISGSLTPQRATEPIDIDATFDGPRVRYTDREERAIGARALPSRVARPWFTAPVLIFEDRLWLSRLPFDKIRIAARLRLTGRETLDGVECHVLRAEMTGGVEYYLLYVGVEDNLLRRHRRGFDSRNIPGGLPMTGYEQTDYQRIEVNPAIPDAAFVLPAPDGWRNESFPGDDLPPGSGNSAATGSATVPGPGRFTPTGEENGGDDGIMEPGEDEAAAAAEGGISVPIPAAMTMALDFEIDDRAGQKVRLSDLRGRPAVLVFWGAWSPWARDALTQVAPVVRDHGSARLLVLSLRDRSRQSAVEGHDQQGAPGTLLPAADEVASRYEVAAAPTVIVVGPSGEIVLRHSGSAPDLAQRVQRALAGQ